MSAGCKPHGHREPCHECEFEAMEPSSEERDYVESERAYHRHFEAVTYKPALFNAASVLRWKRTFSALLTEAATSHRAS